MADSLSSLNPHETGASSGLLLWKFLKILFPFLRLLLHLLFDTQDVICSHVLSARFHSLKLIDISVSKAKYYFASSHSAQVQLGLSHHMMVMSGTDGIVAVFTLDNLYDDGTTYYT